MKGGAPRAKQAGARSGGERRGEEELRLRSGDERCWEARWSARGKKLPGGRETRPRHAPGRWIVPDLHRLSKVSVRRRGRGELAPRTLSA